MSETYLFDTYALMEIMQSNSLYLTYVENFNMIINDFIFAEFCYNLFRENTKNAKDYIKEIVPAIVHVESGIIEEAMEFRVEHKKQNLSMTDCISYIMSKNLGIKFLTGDKQFQNLENVEFVK